MTSEPSAPAPAQPLPDWSQGFALCLSGGGFRATLFHLGVLRYLLDQGALPYLRNVISVSGGSILAAHLACNWSRYSDPKRFKDAEAELLEFTRSDVRGRILLLWLLGFPFSVFAPRLRMAALLEAQLARLLGEATTLTALAPAGGPGFEILATSLSTGELCSFNADRVAFFDDAGTMTDPLPPTASHLPLAKAVAASCAFPALFPPIALSTAELFEDNKKIGNHQLTDGGVHDNVGTRMLSSLPVASASTFQYALLSDASAQYDHAAEETSFRNVVARSVRVTDHMANRIARFERAARTAIPQKILEVNIRSATPAVAPELAEGIQKAAAKLRTDLDAFNELEATALRSHGYCVAHRTCQGVPPTENPYHDATLTLNRLRALGPGSQLKLGRLGFLVFGIGLLYAAVILAIAATFVYFLRSAPPDPSLAQMLACNQTINAATNRLEQLAAHKGLAAVVVLDGALFASRDPASGYACPSGPPSKRIPLVARFLSRAAELRIPVVLLSNQHQSRKATLRTHLAHIELPSLQYEYLLRENNGLPDFAGRFEQISKRYTKLLVIGSNPLTDFPRSEGVSDGEHSKWGSEWFLLPWLGERPPSSSP